MHPCMTPEKHLLSAGFDHISLSIISLEDAIQVTIVSRNMLYVDGMLIVKGRDPKNIYKVDTSKLGNFTEDSSMYMVKIKYGDPDLLDRITMICNLGIYISNIK